MVVYRLSQILILLTLVLLFIGGLVTSTDSGLAVPDWPLSYGTLTPPMIGGIRFEHTHRVAAATVGFLTLILTLWIGVTEKRNSVRRLAIACLAAVVTQGILGGMTVLYRLPAWISILHACLGPTFFCLMVLLAESIRSSKKVCAKGGSAVTSSSSRGLSPGYLSLGAQDDGIGFQRLALMSRFLVLVVFLQIFLGAVVRHTGEGLAFHVSTAIFIFLISGSFVFQAMMTYNEKRSH